MKKFIINILGIFIVIMSSCIKDKATITEATLINNSGTEIAILFYKNGIVHPSDSININNTDSFQYAEPDAKRGTVDNPGFSSEHSGGPDDSCVVIFDGTHRVTHYYNTPDILSEKYHLNSSPRNISNPANYDFVMIRKKNERRNLHYYTFIPADYQFAKE